MKTVTRHLGLALIIALWTGSFASADIILLSDNFNANGYSYPTSLRNHNVQGGTLASTTLYGGQNGMYYGTDFITTAGTGGNRIYVSINSNDMPVSNTILSYSLKMDATLSTQLYFGFSGDESTGPFDIGENLGVSGELYIQTIYNSTEDETVCNLYYGGATKLASITNSGGGLVAYNLTYDFAENMIIEASADGTSIVSNYDLDNVGFTPNIQALQFQTVAYGGSTGMAVADDLLITAIPEPVTMSVMGLGGVILLLLRRRLLKNL